MLLAIDIGNTHAVLGVFDGTDLKGHWRLQSDVDRTVDEYAIDILALLEAGSFAPSSISKIVMSCVVPALSRVFTKFSRKYLDLEPLAVGPGVKTGMKISVDDPRSVGADRIVNAVAAKTLKGSPVICVDFGTATTFDIVGEDGSYQGGVISPGLVISATALFSKAARLPAIELTPPKDVIGRNTVDSMLSGIIYGYVGLVDGIIERLHREMGMKPALIATGGLAGMIADESKYIKEVIPDLTLMGLQIIADGN